MEIIKVYTTSRGIFLSKEEAELNVNRPKNYDHYHGKVMREEVKEKWVLSNNGVYFDLSVIKVKE
jgi:hypothetical protein